jgi:hypothetical protein
MSGVVETPARQHTPAGAGADTDGSRTERVTPPLAALGRVLRAPAPFGGGRCPGHPVQRPPEPQFGAQPSQGALIWTPPQGVLQRGVPPRPTTGGTPP